MLAFAIVRWQINLQLRLLLGYVGAATGVLIGRHLELRRVGFDPQSGTWASKLVRFVLTIAIALGVLIGLGRVSATFAQVDSIAGYALQYLRYTCVGLVVIFGAPFAFVRLGLATRAVE